MPPPYAAPVYQDEALNQNVSKLAESSLALAEHTALQNQLYTALTKQVIDNTAALAMSEEYFCQVAPRGSEEYLDRAGVLAIGDEGHLDGR